MGKNPDPGFGMNIPDSQHCFFLYLKVIFALLDPDPDPATQINADPCGSQQPCQFCNKNSWYGSGSKFSESRYETLINLICAPLTSISCQNGGKRTRTVSAKNGQITTKGGKITRGFSLPIQSFPIHSDRKQEQARVLISKYG
jgi:hypothetical protein